MDVFSAGILLYIIIGAISWIVMALACAWLAGQKGRDKITWGLLGLILGLLALILLAVAPSKVKKEEKTS